MDFDRFALVLTRRTAVYMLVELDRFALVLTRLTAVYMWVEIRPICVGFDTSDSRLHVGQF